LVDYLSGKKTLLLFDWIKGNKEMKSLEQEYILYERDVLRLAEGFCWLTDSLATIAESECWKKKRKEDLKKIILLSERLIEGIEEEGLSLARLYIPGLSRDYIRRLVGAGYTDEKCLREAQEEELVKVLPRRLVKRIQERIKEDKVIQEVKKQKLIVEAENCKPVILPSSLKTTDTTSVFHNLQPISASSPPKTENRKPTFATILEIDRHRPDRIIFEGKKIEVTATEFSLIYLLAQNRGKILTRNDFLDTIWKESGDATYVQITYHLYKTRRVILKTIGNNKKNKEKVKDILKVISRRGIMLNLAENKLKIN